MNNQLHHIEWVIEGLLARASRPCYWIDPTPEVVMDWISKAKRMGIKSIICFLSESELADFYGPAGIDLLDCYRRNGFEVTQIPVPDDCNPPLATAHLLRFMVTLRQTSRPLLLHCSAGVDRTGMAVELVQGSPRLLHHLKASGRD